MTSEASEQGSTLAPTSMLRSIASLGVLFLAIGCDDPMLELCQTPHSAPVVRKTKTVVIEPEAKPVVKPKEIAPPIENRSAEPPPIPKKKEPDRPKSPSPEPEPIAPAPTTMVSKQVPAEPKVILAEPSLITVTPNFFQPSRKRAIQPAEAAIKDVKPKPIGQRIELLTMPAKARLDQSVIAIARLVGPDSKPITDAEIELAIDRSGVGVITSAGGKEEDDARSFRKSSTLARCRTSTTTYMLDRKGIADESITIRPGDAWCVLQSPSPGDAILTAHSVDIVHADRCQAVHRMHWYEAELQVSPEWDVVGGEPVSLVARVLNAKGDVLGGYPVRFEVLDAPSAAFSNGAPTSEKTSDSAGSATTILRPTGESAHRAKVRVQLFGRPLLPGQPTLLDDRTVEVRWSSAGEVELDVQAPLTAAVGSVVTVTTRLDDSRTKNLQGKVVALVGSGTEVISQLAEGKDEAGLRFALAEIGGGKPKSISDLAITSREPGERRVRIELREGERVQAAKDVVIRFIQPRLSVEKSYPEAWRVGQRAEYSIRVKNIGEVATDHVTLEDEIPIGLRIDATDGLRFVDRLRWEIARLNPGQETTLRVSATPTQGFERLAVRAWADDTLAQKVETFDLLDVRGVDTVEVTLSDVADPAPLAGEAQYDIEVFNRGTAPADAIALSARLSNHLRATSVAGSLPASVRDGLLELGTIPRLEPGQRMNLRVRAQTLQEGDARMAVAVQHASLGPAGLLQQESTRVYKP